MILRSLFPRAGLLALMLLTAACDGQGLGQTLGFDRTAPDEFTVVSRPSLSVPPEFTLHPPRPGEEPRGIASDEAARSLLTGVAPKNPDGLVAPKVDTAVTPVITSEAPSGPSMQFLKKLGADTADEDIRTKLSADAVAPVDTSNAESLYDQLVGESKEEPVVDAAKESERLRSNKDAGKPVNEGEVPVEPVRPPTMLDKLF